MTPIGAKTYTTRHIEAPTYVVPHIVGPESDEMSGSDRKITALVVDDDMLIREMVGAWLAEAGYNVVSADDGTTGLAAFSRHGPDIVVTDMSMPGMHGLEFCRRLREVSQVPILVFSAGRDSDAEAASLKAGANAYVAEGSSMIEFLDLVARLAQEQRLNPV